MAKHVGPLFFTGTIDGLIFYKVGEQYFIRSKGSYKSDKYMRRNTRYKHTMQNADQFGEASKLVRNVYYQYLPKSIRKRGLYGELTGKVKLWLQEGKSKQEAFALLAAHCRSLTTVMEQPPMANKQEATLTIQSPILISKQCSTSTVQPKHKQARYLSQWKVRHNGRLQVLRSDGSSLLVVPVEAKTSSS